MDGVFEHFAAIWVVQMYHANAFEVHLHQALHQAVHFCRVTGAHMEHAARALAQ